jgi:predicted dehydrogenase
MAGERGERVVTEVYRAAIIGTGRIGSTYDDEVVHKEANDFHQGANRHNGLYTVLPINHAGAYQTTPGFQLVAAANRGEPKLKAFGERWGVDALYTDYQALLREERPDVVSVCTQSPEKAEIVIAAAEAGVRAIVVEKALATSMAEADAMIEACERRNVLFVTNHPNRFSPVNRQAKALIDSGAIGEVGTVTAHASSGMLHVGTHTFDILRYWLGDVVELTAQVPNYQPEKDLPATGTLTFASGVTGFFDHVHAVQPDYVVRGKSGSIVTSSTVGDGWLHQTELLNQDGTRAYPSKITSTPIGVEPHKLSMTQRLFAELHDSLATGAPFISTGRDGGAALELGLACYASHLAGGPVSLPLADRDLRVPNR